MIVGKVRVAAILRGAHAPRVLNPAPRRIARAAKTFASYPPIRRVKLFAARRRERHARRARSPELAARIWKVARTVALLASLLFFTACRQDMYNQPKAKTYSASEFFSDGTSARPIPPHTVEFHGAPQNEAFYTGLTNDVLLAQLPIPVTPELLQRGRERYDIYCAVCHGATGEGNGEVVQRGFPAPPTYHSERLRHAPIGHFFDVMTNGYGVMYSYASRVDPNDRWAIAAYIRALQLSRNATTNELPPAEWKQLEKTR